MDSCNSVISKKFDAYDSNEPPRFMSLLKNLPVAMDYVFWQKVFKKKIVKFSLLKCKKYCWF